MCRLTERLRGAWAKRAITHAAVSALSVGAVVSAMHVVPVAAFAQQPAGAAEVNPAQKLLLQAAGRFGRGLFRPAAGDYESFLKQFPQHAEATNARYALAICHYRLNEFDKAVPLLEQVLADAKFAQRDEATAVLGHANLSSQKYDAAIAAFDKLLTNFPQSKHAEGASLNKAQTLYLATKYDAAAKAADAFLKAYPASADRPTALYFKGLSEKALDQNAAAATTLSGLLKEQPETRFKLDALLVLGQALEGDNKLPEAAATFKQMLDAAPAIRQPDAHYSLGAVLYRLGKYEDASKEFSAVLSKSPEGPYAKAAKLQLGLSQLAGGKTADAKKTLSAVAKEDAPNAPAARYGLAQCDIADKKFDVALATLTELAAVQPPPANLAQIALDRGICLAELGKHQEAADVFGKLAADAKSPRLAEAQYRQAFSLHKLSQFEPSHAVCMKLIAAGDAVPAEFRGAIADLDAENLFLLARYDDAAKAYTALDAASKDDDARTRYAFRLGQCAYSTGDYVKAVTLLTPLAEKPEVKGDETLGRAVFLLGDALLQQAKFAEAADAFGKFLATTKTAEKSDKQEAQYKQAVALLRGASQGQPAPATVKPLLATVAAGPETSQWTARANFELGQLAYQSKPPALDVAASHLKKVMAFDAGKPPEDLAGPALYLLGWCDYDGKKFAEAAAKWGDLLAKYPKATVAPDAAFHRGVALRDAGENEKALEALTAYAKGYPQGQYAFKCKQLAAACLTSLKREPEAKAMLATLADDKAGVTDAVLYDLAWAQKGTKDDAGAAKSYRRLIADFPQSKLAPAAKAELAEFLFNDKKYAEAAELLEPVVAAKDVDAKVRSSAAYRLALCYEKLEKADKAAATFAMYAAEFGGSDELGGTALLQAGSNHASLGRYEEAIKSLAEMLKKFPAHPQANIAQLKLAEAYADAGRFPEALAAHQAFLQKYPKDPFAFRSQFGVGWALQNQKQYEEARKAYTKVTASNNGETAARAQFQIGDSLLTEGKFEEAALAFLVVEDVYAYPVWSARALYGAGLAFEQLKQPDMARQQFETILKKYKDQADEAKLAQTKLNELKKG
ncbi:tetratricopeptide repeat protein [Humisphaera borealis]|uniref:Tetratricopeptide repeat protein n=1 Tax=Humisphaera borealis TaxID=2807512 RepID=A0A7M2WS93_9BACT|nr:tetratricopeptide repeat protein [Humisphaera borealis]QOV88336.1 tetratricopeptide repeat protein [Humisphaera borealis]